jgi:hypothetical protein
MQHNQYGINGWIQDDVGTDLYLGNGQSQTLGGGWGFFWISGHCSDNSAAFTWPTNYGDVYIQTDGYLHDASGKEQRLSPKTDGFSAKFMT